MVGVCVVGITACSSESGTQVVNYRTLSVDDYSLYDGTDFRMQYPNGWASVSGDEVYTKYKSSAELVLVSDKKDAFFTPNVIVEKMKLDDAQKAKSLADIYSDLEKANDKSLLLSEETSRAEFTTIVNGSAANGLLVEFKAKRRLETDVLTYVVAVLKDDVAGEIVVATAAFDELDNNNQSTEIVESLKTLAIK